MFLLSVYQEFLMNNKEHNHQTEPSLTAELGLYLDLQRTKYYLLNFVVTKQ